MKAKLYLQAGNSKRMGKAATIKQDCCCHLLKKDNPQFLCQACNKPLGSTEFLLVPFYQSREANYYLQCLSSLHEALTTWITLCSKLFPLNMAFYLAPLMHIFPSFLVEAVPELAAMSPALRLVLLPELSPWWENDGAVTEGSTGTTETEFTAVSIRGLSHHVWGHQEMYKRSLSSFRQSKTRLCALDWRIWQVMYHTFPGSRISTVHRKHSTKLVNRGHTTKLHSESSFHSNSRHKFNQNSGFCMQLSRQQKSELPHVPIY